VAPGTYTVRLSVGGQEYSQDLEILKDPRSEGTLADIQEMVALQLEVREDITAISGMINNIEWMKKQLNDLKEGLSWDDGNATVLAEAEGLYKELQALEDKMLQPIAVEGDSKSFRFPNMLYSKMSVLGGDLASSVDFSPNQQQREVHQVLKAEMIQYQGELQALMRGEVAAFNRLLADQNLSGVIMPPGGSD
jgi:hypothetical protein